MHAGACSIAVYALHSWARPPRHPNVANEMKIYLMESNMDDAIHQ